MILPLALPGIAAAAILIFGQALLVAPAAFVVMLGAKMLTKFLVENVVKDRGASNRLAAAFQTLVPDPDRQQSILAAATEQAESKMTVGSARGMQGLEVDGHARDRRCGISYRVPVRISIVS